MTKKSIIITSILLSILALLFILFGAVFRLRQIDVVRPEGSEIAVTDQDIIAASKLKLGKSIFMLDKQSAIDEIEQTYAEIKVVQIKTVSVVRVQIVVRERVEMFYAEYNNSFYCLDEDLKVLRQTETEPTNLIKIETDLGITSNTKLHDFLNKDYALITYKLFTAMYTNVKVEDHYAERADICNLISSVKFEKGYELIDENNAVSFTNLIITTRAGLTMKIAAPENELGKKVNICFSTFDSLEDKTKGKIVIKYNGTAAYYPEA